MFIRTKTFYNKDGSKRVYLQIAENLWENGKARQRVICTLGRLKNLQKSIDTLLEGLAKFSERMQIIKRGKDLLAE